MELLLDLWLASRPDRVFCRHLRLNHWERLGPAPGSVVALAGLKKVGAKALRLYRQGLPAAEFEPAAETAPADRGRVVFGLAPEDSGALVKLALASGMQ